MTDYKRITDEAVNKMKDYFYAEFDAMVAPDYKPKKTPYEGLNKAMDVKFEGLSETDKSFWRGESE